MVRYKEGIPRDQLILYGTLLDDIIEDNSRVRFIDWYVEQLNMEELEFILPKSSIGASSYKKKDLLKIYIYGYLESIRSSRRLEKECKRNDEMRWLICDLKPDFKTIANFRKDNPQALKNLFKKFLKDCKKIELLSYKLIAVDGTKLRAQNSSNNVYHRDTISHVEKKIDEKIESYLRDLDKQDKYEDKNDISVLPNEKIIERLKNLKKQKDKINIIKSLFENDSDLDRYFANDPDSRFQKDKGQAYVGYNCQIAVDNKNKLIVEAEVTNKNNDQQQLANMTKKIAQTKKELKVDTDTIELTDAGYYSEKEIIEAEKTDGIDTYVIHPQDAKKANHKARRNKKETVPDDEHKIDKFHYNKNEDTFTCPEGKILEKSGKTKYDKRRKLNIKRYLCQDCNKCSKKSKCTKHKTGRYLEITENYVDMQKYRNKVLSEKGKRLTNNRKEIVEHPFGTIKSILGYNSFMQTGIEKISAEFKFIAFIYNFKRIMNILSLNDFKLVLNYT